MTISLILYWKKIIKVEAAVIQVGCFVIKASIPEGQRSNTRIL